MHRQSIKRITFRRVTVVSCILFTMVTALLVLSPTVFGNDTEHPRAVAGLTVILNKLDKALEALPEDKFPALEEQLEGISNLLSDLLDELEAPPAPGEKPQVKQQIVKLDLMLHRLVFILEGIVRRDEGVPQPSERSGKAREALEDLRIWVDGYIAGLTARMGSTEAQEFERLARIMLKDIERHVARMASHFRPKDQDAGRVEIALERIKALLTRLDVYIIRNFGRPLAPESPAP